MRRVFIEGEPVLSGGRGQDDWLEAIRSGIARLSLPVRRPRLSFVVSGLRRRGHPFDLDNLVHGPLLVLDEPVDSVSARLYVGDRPGLLVEDRAPRPPTSVLRSIYVESHSERSHRTRVGIPEIADDSVFDECDGIGLSIEFDRQDIPIRKGWFGLTEAVVDDLSPWLGRYTSRGLIADHRIRDMRFTRGIDPTRRGARITIWYVPDAEIPVPGEILELISTAEEG